MQYSLCQRWKSFNLQNLPLIALLLLKKKNKSLKKKFVTGVMGQNQGQFSCETD